MNALWPTAYLLLCAVAARPLYSVMGGSHGAGDAAEVPGRLLCTCVAFFVPFLALGWLELLTGHAWVSVERAMIPLAVAAIWLLWSQRRTGSPRPGSTNRATLFDLPRLLIWATALVYLTLLGFTLAQFPLGFEVAAYQLPSAVHILQNSTIHAWDPHYPHTFPQNPGLYFGFFLDFLPERVAAASNFFFVAVLVAGVYCLARQVGADRRAALIATCGLLTLPMVAFAAGELNADLGGAALLALAVVIAFAKGARRRWVLSGLAAGLAFGFKTMHLVPMGFLFLCALGAGWREPAASERLLARLAPALRSGSLFAVGAFLTAGVWLARNWIEYGNPLYPVNLPLAGAWLGWSVDPAVDFSTRHFTQFEFVSEPWHWLAYPWFEWHQYGQHFKYSAGLGPYFAAAVPAAWTASLIAGLRHGWQRTGRLQLLSLCSALILAVWWVMDDRQPRYLLGMQILLIPLSAWLLSAQASVRTRVWLERLFALCILFMLAVVVSKEAVDFGDRVLLSRQTTRAAFYEYPAVVDELPAGSAILNLGSRTWQYPLFGERLHNRVISTPKARSMLGLPPSLGGIRDAMLLAEPLKREGVEYVFSDRGTVQTDGCLSLQELHRQTVNPQNKVPLREPRTLYRVSYCEPVLDPPVAGQ